MLDNTNEIVIPSVRAIKNLLDPVLVRLDKIEDRLKGKSKNSIPKKYYRNADLRALFGLSPNTIIKYRETGVLPFTKLGELYLYEVKVIEAILKENTVKI